MTVGFHGRVAVVTGAGHGLGRSHALLLASRGAHVVVNDLGTAVDGSGADARVADAVVQEIRANGGSAVANYASVATVDGGEEIVTAAIDHFGRIDILVNNAGIIRVQGFAALDWEHLDRMVDVHLKGAFYVTRPAYRHMRERGYGRIVFTTSAAALFGSPGVSPYGAAKGGILGLMHVLKLEAARFGIKVNAIAPVANTRMGQDVHQEQAANGSMDAHYPTLISPAVAYLCSDECDLTGEVWSVAGGSVARIFTARARGYFKDPRIDGVMSVEDVAANLGSIRGEEGYSVPSSWLEESASVQQLLEGP